MAQSTLPTLIKIAERKVEDIQLELGRTARALEAVRNDMATREEAMEKAFADAVGSDDLRELQAVGAFRERLTREVNQLREIEAGLVQQEAAVRSRLQEAFLEQKRYELLQQRKEMAEKKAHDRKAQAVLDDLGQKKVIGN
ncbi:MAG: hypothetical protein GC129_03030 [Proteobacteria bacterium]|nr:hypothetical protein [Pseudomonadota bacterium]